MPFLKTVALIDDDPIYTQAFKNLLNTWRIANPFLFFADGKEALNFIQVKEASALPDIILLDLNMPVMNGWSFLENFTKVAHQLPKSITIYLVSSSIWYKDIKRAKENYLVKEFITKPILREKLREILG